MKTSFKVEATSTGFKVRVITEKSTGKTTSRLIGRPRTYDEVDSLIEAYEMGVGHL